MNVTLLRHAQTAGNMAKQYIGSSDEELCDAGITRAESLAPNTEVTTVYTSTLARTVHTARILYPAAHIHRIADLNEMDFGLFEQKSWRDLERNDSYRAWVDSQCEQACPEGEAKAAFTKRCVKAFSEIVAREHAKGAGQLHCVVHGGTIMALLSELAIPIRAYFDWSADFCGGYLLEYDDAGNAERPLKLVSAIRPKQS